MPLLWLSLAFILGLWAASLAALPVWAWLGMGVTCLLGAWFEWRWFRDRSHALLSNPLFRLPVSLLMAACALGAARFEAQLPRFSERDLAFCAGGNDVTVIGRIVSFPQQSSSSTTAIVAAQTVSLPGGEVLPVSGKLEVRLPGGFHLSYGDILRLRGDLRPVGREGAPPYLAFLPRHGVHCRMAYPQLKTLERGSGRTPMGRIYALRQRALEVIYELLPFPESALLAGILLGVDWVIPPYLRSAYRACGVLHIIAISGFNLALISGLTIQLTRRLFRPQKAALIAVAAILGYTLLVGAEPAVVRAAIMSSLTIPAHLIGRRTIALHSLTVVAALMLMGNPFLLWIISFQLSFLACLGLMSMADPLLRWSNRGIAQLTSEWYSLLLQPLLVLLIGILCAQFAVLPAILKLDGQLALFSLPANLALLPIQPFLMYLGGITVISGLLLPPISQVLAYFAWPFLAYCNRIAMHFGFHPSGQVPLPDWVTLVCALLVYGTLLVFSIWQLMRIQRPEIQGEISGGS